MSYDLPFSHKEYDKLYSIIETEWIRAGKIAIVDGVMFPYKDLLIEAKMRDGMICKINGVKSRVGWERNDKFFRFKNYLLHAVFNENLLGINFIYFF